MSRLFGGHPTIRSHLGFLTPGRCSLCGQRSLEAKAWLVDVADSHPRFKLPTLIGWPYRLLREVMPISHRGDPWHTSELWEHVSQRCRALLQDRRKVEQLKQSTTSRRLETCANIFISCRGACQVTRECGLSSQRCGRLLYSSWLVKAGKKSRRWRISSVLASSWLHCMPLPVTPASEAVIQRWESVYFGGVSSAFCPIARRPQSPKFERPRVPFNFHALYLDIDLILWDQRLIQKRGVFQVYRHHMA